MQDGVKTNNISKLNVKSTKGSRTFFIVNVIDKFKTIEKSNGKKTLTNLFNDFSFDTIGSFHVKSIKKLQSSISPFLDFNENFKIPSDKIRMHF